MTCLHPNRKSNTTSPHLNQRLAFALQEPAILEHCRSCLAVRLALRIALITLLSGNSQHSSEILATLPEGGAGAGAGAGAGGPVEAIYRRQIEAAAPDLVLTAPRRVLCSPTSTSQLRTILKAVF